MTFFDFSTLQRAAVSIVAALIFATLTVTAAVGPAEATILATPVL